MNQYETVFIANPVLSAAQMKEAVAKFRDLITGNEGEIVHEEDWGLKKLAYPIQKKTTGFYYLLEFKANPDFISKFETELRRDEKIMRFLTVKLDKFAIEYNEHKLAARRGEVKDEQKWRNIIMSTTQNQGNTLLNPAINRHQKKKILSFSQKQNSLYRL